MAQNTLLELHHLNKRFVVSRSMITRKTVEVSAVNDISLSVRRGEVLGLVGESGCGKSTLGRTILNLIPKTSGQVIYDGTDLDSLRPAEVRRYRQKMQMIFQDPYASLNPRMTVGQLVQEPLDIFGIGTRSERAERVREILEIVGMGTHHLQRYPHEFSGGQRQRIGIARALVLNPEFVVCDEPVSALDVSVRASVLNLIRDLQERFGLTYLFISHDLSVVKHVSDRIAVMYLGHLVELADRQTIYENPRHPYTQALLSAIPIADPDAMTVSQILPGEPPSPYDPPKGCPFHTRCPHCTGQCRETNPALAEMGVGHKVACHLYSAEMPDPSSYI